MIRIISNGTFGFHNGKFVEPKKKGDEPFSIDPKREAELVALGIAEYVGEEAPAAVEPAEDAEAENDGEEQAVENTEAQQEVPAEIWEGFEVTLEYLEGLKLEHLKEFAAQFGIEYKIGMKKVDFAKLVFDSLDPETNEELTYNEDGDEAENDGEQPPVVNAADAIV